MVSHAILRIRWTSQKIMPRCAAPRSAPSASVPYSPLRSAPCSTCTHSSFLALHAASTYKASSPSLPPPLPLPLPLPRPRLSALSLSHPSPPFPSRSATPMRESREASERAPLVRLLLESSGWVPKCLPTASTPLTGSEMACRHHFLVSSTFCSNLWYRFRNGLNLNYIG